ncbi:MAG: hypothetical protein PHX09_03310 [Clostridia bacterium]|nr:hypothetical protein [Clostridia bacterium]
MSRFIFVEPEQYEKVSQGLRTIIKRLHNILSNWGVCTFEEILIGSGKYGLVTYDTKGNKGFDFDFNLNVQQVFDDFCDEEGVFTAKDLKLAIMEGLKEALKDTNYKNPKDSSSVITIKVVDQENSSILYGADFAVMYNSEKIKYDKKAKSYYFEEKSLKQYSENDKIDIIKRDNHWNEFRERYLEKKNSDLNKKSSSIRRETTNDIWTKYYH